MFRPTMRDENVTRSPKYINFKDKDKTDVKFRDKTKFHFLHKVCCMLVRMKTLNLKILPKDSVKFLNI